MSDDTLERLLGSDARDPGCDAAFEQLDAYCDAVQRGEDVRRRFAGFIAHIGNCAACREDTAGLLAALGQAEAGGEAAPPA